MEPSKAKEISNKVINSIKENKILIEDVELTFFSYPQNLDGEITIKYIDNLRENDISGFVIVDEFPKDEFQFMIKKCEECNYESLYIIKLNSSKESITVYKYYLPLWWYNMKIDSYGRIYKDSDDELYIG